MYNFLNKNYISFSEGHFWHVANSAAPDEMSLYAAFHLCLHCLSKHMFRCFRSAERQLFSEYNCLIVSRGSGLLHGDN